MILAVLLAAGCSNDSAGVGSSPPDIKIEPLNSPGQITTLSSKLKSSKYILLDFWATWCSPCREAMPEIQALWEKYRGQGFEVLSISNEDRAAVEAFHRDMPTSYDIYLDPDSAASKTFQVENLPTFFLIKDGKIAWKLVGYAPGMLAQGIEPELKP